MSILKKTILGVVLVVLIAAVLYLVVFKKSGSKLPQSALPSSQELTTGPITPPSETAVINNANPNFYSFAGDPKAEKVEVEFMGDAEKEGLGIPVSSRIQVLERDASGKCIAWKLINQDSEILHEYVK